MLYTKFYSAPIYLALKNRKKKHEKASCNSVALICCLSGLAPVDILADAPVDYIPRIGLAVAGAAYFMI